MSSFEWIPSTSRPRSYRDKKEGYLNSGKDRNYYGMGIVRDYVRYCPPSRWFIEKVSKKGWSDDDITRMMGELDQLEETKE